MPIYLKNSENISQKIISQKRNLKKSKIIYLGKKYLENGINISQLNIVPSRFCVYRMKMVRFPMRHGTNNLFKFEYVVTVTRERPTDDTNTSKGDAR